jgi:hypothetical protein
MTISERAKTLSSWRVLLFSLTLLGGELDDRCDDECPERKKKMFRFVFFSFSPKVQKTEQQSFTKLDVKFRLDKSGTSDEKMHKKFENFLKDFDLDDLT